MKVSDGHCNHKPIHQSNCQNFCKPIGGWVDGTAASILQNGAGGGVKWGDLLKHEGKTIKLIRLEPQTISLSLKWEKDKPSFIPRLFEVSTLLYACVYDLESIM
jgi:hypothetical protein